ncbi:MAG: hypothetical protein Harvfovirus41_11 [Harvfovirus sp.]|uniref:Uncharacterized protein n=1 Tax=Harvfovirus sp. TaxID=2487768 RepID=A0A3G5A2W4_9VIRU|nr:MAG: hypothetical protein Harvfovirus41_11 [Harvfovirus sp.]
MEKGVNEVNPKTTSNARRKIFKIKYGIIIFSCFSVHLIHPFFYF